MTKSKGISFFSNSIIIIVTAVFIISYCILTIDSSFAQEIPETIMIEHTIHRLDRFGPVKFEHQNHIDLEIACKKCHHDWDEKSYDLPVGCIKCHGKDSVGNVVSLRTAYLKQCIGCHLITTPDGKKRGPTICTDCHLYKKY